MHVVAIAFSAAWSETWGIKEHRRDMIIKKCPFLSQDGLHAECAWEDAGWVTSPALSGGAIVVRKKSEAVGKL